MFESAAGKAKATRAKTHLLRLMTIIVDSRLKSRMAAPCASLALPVDVDDADGATLRRAASAGLAANLSLAMLVVRSFE